MDGMKKSALDYSRKKKIEIRILAQMRTKDDLALAYTPGIAEVCRTIINDESLMYEFTARRNMVAVISDGSAVLGLGDIGHKASYPVMEGKSMLFKRFGNVDAIPLIIGTKDVEEFVETVKNISDSFAAINLEDISAPRCFEIERRLREVCSIPVFHDDQHGTAIVVLAALLNALKLSGKGKDVKIVINGAGSAGIAIANLSNRYGFTDMIICDSRGIIHRGREDLNPYKKEILSYANKNNISGDLKTALKGADVFIGVSKGGIVTANDIKTMNKKPIIFAMANPIPEIMPHDALKGGAFIVGTGRSDLPNQINNALAFPGLFRGVIDARARAIDDEMKIEAAKAIVDYHRNSLSKDMILPQILDEKVHRFIAERVRRLILSKHK
ncbi:MAG: NADP-dependent malic enzyme [Candidatus Micrarchaeota archaeon]|nr:NADP-dependent malic enzyme [Candidatus Micrarchaeota archaeon]